MTPPMSLRSHAKAVLALGLPLAGSGLAQVALHVTDTVMVGWYGVEPLAALVLGTSLFIVVFLVGTGFSQAVMPLVATAAARHRDAEVRQTVRMGLWLGGLYALAMLPLFWWSEAVFVRLGQAPATAARAQDYLRIIGPGLVPGLAAAVLRSHLAALGHTRIVLFATIAGAVLNGCLNWLLIFGHWGAPELGVRGAAIATLATQTLAVTILVVYAGRRGPLARFTLFVRFWRADWPIFSRVFRLGWPIGLTALAESGLFVATAIMMGWIGSEALAAHGIAMELASIVFMVHVGLSQAATVRAGWAAAEDDRAELRRGAWMALGLSAAFALVAVAAFLAMPRTLVGLFLAAGDPEAPAIVALGAGLLAMAALFHFADAGQVMALGLLRGLQDTRVPMLIAVVSYWGIGVPASYVIGIRMGQGPVGLWFGMALGLIVAAGLLLARFVSATAERRVLVQVP